MPCRRLPLTLAVVLPMLSGCIVHAPGKDEVPTPGARAAAITKLQDTTPCCARFSDFDFSRALPARPRRFVVEPGLPVADFNGTHSYFLAFTLPPNHPVPYRVVLKSEITGRWLYMSYLFAPSVVILDAAYQPIKTMDVKQCEYIGWSSSTTGALGSINIDTKRARYLVVYTSGDQLASSTYWEQSPTAFSADAPVRMAATGSFQIAHGPNGPLYVGLMTPRYAHAESEAICGKQTQNGKGALSTLRSLILPSDGKKVQ